MKAKKPIETLILAVRGQKVILDADLAEIYGVETRVLNQAVKRNAERFPDDFLFELTREEILRISQTVTSLVNLKFSKQVQAFTEHGALMAASVLNSPEAVEMSVFVIRAFVLENVKNLKSHHQGRTFQIIYNTLTNALGYHVQTAIIDAQSVVPRHRERIFLVGFKERRAFEFPQFPAAGPKLESILETDVPIWN